MVGSITSYDGVERNHSTRFHGLDALRGLAMILGIVLHAALPYVPNVGAFWPVDRESSDAIGVVFQFIHIWRMPLFFILAGFFSNLVISRKSWRSWGMNRLLRIGVPIILFWPLVGLTLPWIFKYGRTGELTFFYSDEGQPFHLWFLWHLIIFVAVSTICRLTFLLTSHVENGPNMIGLSFISTVTRQLRSVLTATLFGSRFPVLFVFVCSIVNAKTGGELTVNPMGGGLYFLLGYCLYGNTPLFIFLKTYWKYYLLGGVIVFGLYLMMVFNLSDSRDIVKNIYTEEMSMPIQDKIKFLELSIYILKFVCAVLFSYAFIGLAEKHFGSYNPILRFFSDGAYWMYLIHLPIVTLITFYMFRTHILIEIKFLIAISVTVMICLVTYYCLVRPTPIGILLNGKR